MNGLQPRPGDILLFYGEGGFSRRIRRASWLYRFLMLRRVVRTPSHAEFVLTSDTLIGAVGEGVRTISCELKCSQYNQVELLRIDNPVYSVEKGVAWANKQIGKPYDNRQNVMFGLVGVLNVIWFWLYALLRISVPAFVFTNLPKELFKVRDVSPDGFVCSEFAGACAQIGLGVTEDKLILFSPAGLQDWKETRSLGML